MVPTPHFDVAEAAGATLVINQPMVRRSEKYTGLEGLLTTCHLRMPGTTADYGFPWFVRTYWQIEFVAIGASGFMAKDPKFRFADLGMVFPDQNAWTSALSDVTPTVGQFVKMTGYTGPLHMITMYLCIFGHSGILNISADALLQHRDRLIKARKQFKLQTGINPSPANLVGIVL